MKFVLDSQEFEMDLVTLDVQGECDVPRNMRRSFAMKGLVHILLSDVYQTTPCPEHNVFSLNAKTRKLGEIAAVACHAGAHDEVIQCLRRLVSTSVEQIPTGKLEQAAHLESMKILSEVATMTKRYQDSEQAAKGEGGEDCFMA